MCRCSYSAVEYWSQSKRHWQRWVNSTTSGMISQIVYFELQNFGSKTGVVIPLFEPQKFFFRMTVYSINGKLPVLVDGESILTGRVI